MNPQRRAAVLVGLVALAPAVILGLVALVAGGIAAAVVFVVVAVAVGAWAWTGAERRVLRSLGGRPADRTGEARALNLIEGLSFTAGLHPPELRVLDSEGLNLAVVGRSPSSAVIVATTALLAELTRIELEGALAAALVEIRNGELAPATVAASLPGLGRRLISSGPGRDAATDLAAAGLTRFPPGLASAWDKVGAKGSAVAAVGADQAHLWLADPVVGGRADPNRTALHDRAEALREL